MKNRKLALTREHQLPGVYYGGTPDELQLNESNAYVKARESLEEGGMVVTDANRALACIQEVATANSSATMYIAMRKLVEFNNKNDTNSANLILDKLMAGGIDVSGLLTSVLEISDEEGSVTDSIGNYAGNYKALKASSENDKFLIGSSVEESSLPSIYNDFSLKELELSEEYDYISARRNLEENGLSTVESNILLGHVQQVLKAGTPNARYSAIRGLLEITGEGIVEINRGMSDAMVDGERVNVDLSKVTEAAFGVEIGTDMRNVMQNYMLTYNALTAASREKALLTVN